MTSLEFQGGTHQIVLCPQDTPPQTYYLFISPHASGIVDIQVMLNVAHTQAHVICIQWSHNSQVTIRSTQHHLAPNTTSSVMVRTILDAQAQTTYEGVITIDARATQSSSTQQYHAIMLDEKSYAQATPSLEILTDQVTCSHAAAIGTIAQEMQFFINTRGLSAPHARMLCARGILSELVPLPLRHILESWTSKSAFDTVIQQK